MIDSVFEVETSSLFEIFPLIDRHQLRLVLWPIQPLTLETSFSVATYLSHFEAELLSHDFQTTKNRE